MTPAAATPPSRLQSRGRRRGRRGREGRGEEEKGEDGEEEADKEGMDQRRKNVEKWRGRE